MRDCRGEYHEFPGVPPAGDALRCACGAMQLRNDGQRDPDGTRVLICSPVVALPLARRVPPSPHLHRLRTPPQAPIE